MSFQAGCIHYPGIFLGKFVFLHLQTGIHGPLSVTRAGTASEEGVSRAEDSREWETTRNGASL